MAMPNAEYQANLEALAAARTEQLRDTIHELERSYDTTMESLVDALKLKDAVIANHSNRVCGFTIAIARAMGIPRDRMDVIARGAVLHDIGALGVPEAILQKPSALTTDETAKMREHCSVGYHLLRKIMFLVEPADIVYAHHERYDGTGYPRGLKGGQIPLGARLCSVAEAFDTITSDRPYRKAQSLEAARKEILAWSGKQFDPDVVQVFLNIPEHIWQELRQEVDARD